jgi:hypothetical protein
MKRIMLLTFLGFAATALATPSQDFSAAAAEAARKAKTDAGDRYGTKFVQERSPDFILDAMQSCEHAEFAVGSTCDFILVISASGRVERLLHGRGSPFAQCITSHLQVPRTVAKAPSDHWPLHVRIYRGPPPDRPDPLIMFFATDAKAKR